MKITNDDLSLIANTIRSLAIDAIQKANSGHPGMPMGCADIAAVLWTKIIKYYPEDPAWINRDRFVLSAGHGSMLLYSILHMTGYNLSMEDIKGFRQWESRTPGHPEFGLTPGVETTTGPLGQGFANAVGMAYANSLLAKEFNEKEKIIDHKIYAIASDGDLMEGVSCEAASLAGHWGLGNLIVVYDSNNISIEGSTDLAFSEDVEKRFLSYNWHVQKIDGHNFDQIEKSLLSAQKETKKPSLIIAKTKIAKGSPNMEGCADSHGSPLGDEEIKLTKSNICCDAGKSFCVPDKVYDIFKAVKEETKVKYQQWKTLFDAADKDSFKEKWNKYYTKPDIKKLRESLKAYSPDKDTATRNASGEILKILFKELPNIIGGSADLAPSNKTLIKGYPESGLNATGRNIHFGIREHAMGAIQNGIAYYGGFIPYSATFFSFIDYMRPPVRLAALSHLHSIYVFTHDSIFVGEDGPTHQPVEQLASARAIPNLTVIRPADAIETIEAWLAAIDRNNGPTAFLLSRQNLPIVSKEKAENLHKGAYIIWDCGTAPDILLLASGSEVGISIAAAVELKEAGINARVISFPSWELFEKQDEQYKRSILPENIENRAVIEAGISMGWEKYAGRNALYITMEHFGSSAPYKELAQKYGFTKENVVNRVKEFLKK